MIFSPARAHGATSQGSSVFLKVAALTVAVAALISISGPATADTAADLKQARERAARVEERLSLLEARAEWTNERLAYARERLAEAASNNIDTQQQLDALGGVTNDAAADVAHRIRAIEQSGGPMALYSEALTGTSITDVASNLASLSAVLGTDQAAEQSAIAAVDEATTLQRRLDDIADERAELVAEVRQLAEQAETLADEQTQLLAQVDKDVKQLMRQLADEREAAAAAAAAAAEEAGDRPDVVTTAASNPYAEAAIDAALTKLGSPYVWGDEGPDTFDCSGLVMWSYAQAGLALPRLASDQYFASTPVSVNAMAPGDLLVYAYDTNDDETIHHITMYIGNGQMVHAPRTGDVVRIVPVYYDGLYGVGRPGI